MTDYIKLLTEIDAAVTPADGKDLLEASGIAALTDGADLGDVALCLRRLIPLMPTDPLERRVVRNRAISTLKGFKVGDAAGLVDAALANGVATPAMEMQTAATDTNALLLAARPVLDAPDILSVVSEYVVAAGYAGDTAAVKTVFLSLTSRLLERPVNLFLAGPSAGGKNYTIKSVLPLFPPEAYYSVAGMSPLAVMYSHEPFEHRVLVVSEASAFHDDGIGASLLRGLAWDGELSYDTVIDGEPVHLHKDGPTGLVTTGTKELEPELATRLWTVPIPDDPDHTREVLRVTAQEAAGHRATPLIAADAFVAAQRWLGVAGATKVVVPFAGLLAELVPADEVRLRRDFTQLIALVKTHAFLHQRHRDLDTEGRIVATVDDYAAVRGVVEAMFAMTVSPGLSKEIRETVTAVEVLISQGKTNITNTEIARRLNLSESATWRRVKKALAKRYLVNDEHRRHQPAKIGLGNPLPVPGRVLPLPSDLHANAQTSHLTDEAAGGFEFAQAFAQAGDQGFDGDPDEEARQAQREGA